MSKIILPISEQLFNTLPINNTFQEWNTFPLKIQMQFIDMFNSESYKESQNELNQENETELEKLRNLYL